MAKFQVLRTQLFKEQVVAQSLWYDETTGDPEIADGFITALEQTVKHLSEYPQRYPSWTPDNSELSQVIQNFYKAPIGGNYPFCIYYQLDDEVVILRFIYHDRQDRERTMEKALK